jgi:hypothetical protein
MNIYFPIFTHWCKLEAFADPAVRETRDLVVTLNVKYVTPVDSFFLDFVLLT